MNRIGLDPKKSEELADLLNDLLANYSVFYQNTRGDTIGTYKARSFLNCTLSSKSFTTTCLLRLMKLPREY